MIVKCIRSLFDNVSLYERDHEYDITPAPYLADHFAWPSELKKELQAKKAAAKLAGAVHTPVKPGRDLKDVHADKTSALSNAKPKGGVLSAADLHEKIAQDRKAEKDRLEAEQAEAAAEAKKAGEAAEALENADDASKAFEALVGKAADAEKNVDKKPVDKKAKGKKAAAVVDIDLD